jgi:hypothetical protein
MELVAVPNQARPGTPDWVWASGAKHYGYGHGSGRPDMGDFVPGGFPLPWNPVFADSGVGDFVWGGFPLPQNPVGARASAYGSLPKAPDLPMALIGHGNGAELDAGDCGMGCGCSGGMGALEIPAWAMTLPAPLNGQVAGIPTVYLAGGLLAVFFILPMIGGRKGRR